MRDHHFVQAEQQHTPMSMWSSSAEPKGWQIDKRSSDKHAERGVVMLEGYVEAPDVHDHSLGSSTGEPVAARTKSLTDDDLEELKGCVDLGFGFSYEEIPELCSTLPALELCYSLNQRFLEESSGSSSSSSSSKSPEPATSPLCSSPIPVANWKISSPGDDPDEVKARLKYWAQAVACTVKLCTS